MVKGEVEDGIRKHDVLNHMGSRIQGMDLGHFGGTGMTRKGGMMRLILMVLRPTA